jgi:hypothetical protein
MMGSGCVRTSQSRETDCWLNGGAKNFHNFLDDRSKPCFASGGWESMLWFATVRGTIGNHFYQDHHLNSRANFKLNCTTALAEWRELGVV